MVYLFLFINVQESTAAFNSYSGKIQLEDLMKKTLDSCRTALSNIDQSKNIFFFGNFCKITRKKHQIGCCKPVNNDAYKDIITVFISSVEDIIFYPPKN